MANVFIEELDALLRKMAISEAKQRLTFLEKERLQVSQNLSKAEETLRIFSEKNSVLQIDVQTRGVIEYVAKLRADIDSKEVAIQVMRQQATPFNYDVVRMETEVKGLREKLRNAETQYDNRVTDVCLPTNKTPGLVLEYIRLYREAKFQEALYQLYIKLVEIARMDLVRDHAVIQVVDYAKPPEKRSNKRVLPTLMVGAGSFFLLILVSFGREFLQYLKGNEEQASRIFTLTEYLKPWTKLPARIKNRLLFRRKS